MKPPINPSALLTVFLFISRIGYPIDVYLLGGQSNMQGIGKLSEIADLAPKKIPNTLFFNGTAFEPLVLGSAQTSTRPGEFGPEVGFALEMAHDGRPSCLIKYSASGMPLSHKWNGGNWVGGHPAPGRRNFYPGESNSDVNQGSLYLQMSQRFQAGIQTLESMGHTPEVRGFVWMQGEQDSKHIESATEYAANLARLQRRLSEDLDIEGTLPMVFGQVLPHEPPADRFVARDIIREQLARADQDSNHTEAIQNAKMVSTDTMSLLPDTVHYNAPGLLHLGKAFARAIRKLQESSQVD